MREKHSDFYSTLRRKKKGVIQIAHRGYRAVRPENTLSAFEAAVGSFDAIELDLQLSRDDRWLVLHDDTLERTTDAQERLEGLRPCWFDYYREEELRSLDAGSWFLPRDPFGTLASGVCSFEELEALPIQRIPTFEEVLEFARRSGMPMNLEIKGMPHRDPAVVVDSFLEVLERFEGLGPIIVSSFEHRYLRRLRELRPALHLAALVEHVPLVRPLEYLSRLGVEAYHIDHRLAEETPVEELRRHGILCAAWTVNRPKRAKELEDMGFEAIFCDMPLEW